MVVLILKQVFDVLDSLVCQFVEIVVYDDVCKGEDLGLFQDVVNVWVVLDQVWMSDND